MPSGYRSDCTRTYVIGAPHGIFADAYDVLQRAQAGAVAQVAPGRTCHDVDHYARRVMGGHNVQGTSLADFFIHRIGHGIGLESHENPYLVAGNDEILQEGMTFSIEPGFYVPGQFGARIEDIVACTRGGADVLNTSPRDLVQVEP